MPEANFDYCSNIYSDILFGLPYLEPCDLETLRLESGDFSQADILELGCGDGLCLNHMRDRGARGRLVGTDLSEKLLETACSRETGQTPVIEYRQADAACGESLGQFDLVLAPFLFSLAATPSTLAGMFRTAAQSLRRGGRLVIYDDNVFLHPQHFPNLLSYGIRKWVDSPPLPEEELMAGSHLHLNVSAKNLSFDVTETYLPWDNWQASAISAGFDALDRRPIRVSAEGVVAKGAAYWHDYIHLPATICLVAYKQ